MYIRMIKKLTDKKLRNGFAQMAADRTREREARQMKYISLSVSGVAHMYELALENFCVSKKEGTCHDCLILKKRFEKFLGEKETKRIQQQVKKHPYLRK